MKAIYTIIGKIAQKFHNRRVRQEFTPSTILHRDRFWESYLHILPGTENIRKGWCIVDAHNAFRLILGVFERSGVGIFENPDLIPGIAKRWALFTSKYCYKPIGMP